MGRRYEAEVQLALILEPLVFEVRELALDEAHAEDHQHPCRFLWPPLVPGMVFEDACLAGPGGCVDGHEL